VAVSEAVLLAQLGPANGETYDLGPFSPRQPEKTPPKASFYTAPEITRLISRGGGRKTLFAPIPRGAAGRRIP